MSDPVLGSEVHGGSVGEALASLIKRTDVTGATSFLVSIRNRGYDVWSYGDHFIRMS